MSISRQQIIDRLAEAFEGRAIASIESLEHTWMFTFEGGGRLITETYWRILDRERLVVAGDDHGESFGMPAPLDAIAVAGDRLVGGATGVALRDPACDLLISFDGAVLELFNTSVGYEGWRASLPPGSEVLEVISVGGGDLVAIIEDGAANDA